MADKPLVIFKTLLGFVEGGVTAVVDTIEYRGMPWLVVRWLEHPRERYRTPSRIILLPTLGQFQDLGADHQPHRFVVNGPQPNKLFDAMIPQQLRDRYVIQDEPDLKFPYSPDLS
jgi:hypothetical protein